MPDSASIHGKILRIDRLIYLPTIMMLAAVWLALIDFKIGDRRERLQLVQDELAGSAHIIADSEALLRDTPTSEKQKSAVRDEAIRDALHQRPAAHIWLESSGSVFAGSPIAADSGSFISAVEQRDQFAVHIAMPIDAVLTEWRSSVARWASLLAGMTAALLAAAALLAHVLRKDTLAETNRRQRDAILKVVTDAATTLAGAEDYESVIDEVFAAVCAVVGLDRVILRALMPGKDKRTIISRVIDWCKPGLAPLANDAFMSGADFESAHSPQQVAQLMRGEPLMTYAYEFPEPIKSILIERHVLSNLVFAVIIDGQPYCFLSFTDGYDKKRIWNEAEIDTLRIFTGVIAAAMRRTEQTRQRQLAEANLRKRDEFMSTVTNAATLLLGADDYENVIHDVLAKISMVVGVDRTLLRAVAPGQDNQIISTGVIEWHRPGMTPIASHTTVTDADFKDYYTPEQYTRLVKGEPLMNRADEFPEPQKSILIENGLLSILLFGIILDGQPYGTLSFNDSNNMDREWDDAEIDTLRTLTSVLTVAMARTHQARQRFLAESRLGNRDAIMRAVTESAGNLLNAQDLDKAIVETITTVGQALNVNRVHMTKVSTGPDQRVFVNVTHEWFEPGLADLKTHPAFIDIDITAVYPQKKLEEAFAYREEAFYIKDFPEPLKSTLRNMGIYSVLTISVMVDGEFYGNLIFSDGDPERTDWTSTEIVTLKTITQLVSAALTRAHDQEQRQKAMTGILLRDRALEGISQGVTITDVNVPGLPIIYANAAFAALSGYSIDELIGRGSLSFTDIATLPQSEQRIARGLSEKRSWRMESSFKRKDSTTFLNSTVATVILDQNGVPSHLIAIHEDVTELRKREELLLEAQKMESVGQLTGGIAHDFNNLLTAIKSNAEDLRDDLKDNPLMQSQAEIVLEAADRGAGLVAQLLAFARKQELQPQVVDVSTLILDFAELLRRTLPASIVIETRLAEGLPAVYVDPGRLETAILNLALNASDAMADGGTLTIEAALRALDADYVAEHIEVQQGDYILIAVTDSGVGMSPEVVERAFTPFFTTKEVGKGTGLGLSMVYGFVKQSGGHAHIYSEQGLGTVVKIYLPAMDQAAPAGTDTVHESKATPGSGAILLVEDDKMVRQSITNKLTRLGYQVVAATHALEAIEILKSTPHFDLVFSDVIMPGPMNGADLVREVRRRWPAINVLLTSGYTESTVLGKITLPDDVKLLSKPYTNAELANSIKEALTRSSTKVA